MHSDVTISILCHTAFQQCRRLIDFLVKENSGAKLILTANGNKNAAVYFRGVQAIYPGVTVIENQINQGFIGPNCRAFSLCTTPYMVFLNDDALPPENWIALLKAPFSDPLMAITGAKGTCQTLDHNFIGRPGSTLDYIEFSAAMVKCELMPKPIFDSSLHFAYCEDAFLCLLLREKGLKIAQADFKLTEHFRNTTSRRIPGIRTIMERNFSVCRKRWAYYLKHRKFETV